MDHDKYKKQYPHLYGQGINLLADFCISKGWLTTTEQRQIHKYIPRELKQSFKDWWECIVLKFKTRESL